MSVTRTRLRLIEGRLARRPAPPPAPTGFDPYRLTPREMAELDELLALVPRRPGERWDLEPLTNDQLERMTELTEKAHGVPSSPAFFGMRHRDPGVGECKCVACARQAKGA